jgi:hypothetical protein
MLTTENSNFDLAHLSHVFNNQYSINIHQSTHKGQMIITWMIKTVIPTTVNQQKKKNW